jgi:DNA-binding transcriptional regulator YiaG
MIEFRVENGLSQEGFAAMIGATQAQVSKWENGVIRMSPLRKVDLWLWLENNTAK